MALDGWNTLFGHFSRLTGVLVLIVFAAGAVFIAFRQTRGHLLDLKRLFLFGLCLSLAGLLLLSALKLLTRAGPWLEYAGYYQSLRLPLLFFSLAGLQCLAAAYRLDTDIRTRYPALPWFLGLAAGLLLLAWLARAALRDPGSHFYGFPGIPLLEWQVLFGLAAGFGLYLLQKRRFAGDLQRLDGLVFILLWLGTAALWLWQPLIPGGYALAPREPNYAVYPYSDAMSYDAYAQTLLAGYGFNGQIPPRPLYIAFLAGLRSLAGVDYLAVISLQSLILAVFPALLYRLAVPISGRSAAFMLAILAALRDVNTNQAAPFATNISYSKLLQSELPTAILLVLLALVLLEWRRSAGHGIWQPLTAGGLAGLATLVRTQSLIVMPAAFLLLMLAPGWDRRRVLRGLVLAALACAFTISPWLVRNRLLTGGWVFDDPVTQTEVLAQRYGEAVGAALPPRQPADSDAEHTARLMAFALDSLRRAPFNILAKASSHMLNNLTGSLRVLPFRTEIRAGSDFYAPAWAFWETRIEDLAAGMRGLLLAALAVFVLGLAAAWKRLGWIGLLPLAIHLAYNLWSALFLTSGERFLLPVDWVFLLYLCAGLFALAAMLWPWLDPPAQSAKPAKERPAPARLGLAPALIPLAFFMAGASIPLAESLIPPRIPPQTQADLREAMLHAGAPAGTLDGRQILPGTAFYAMYFPAGSGLGAVQDNGYRASTQARLVFRLVGPRGATAIAPLEISPGRVPDGTQVLAAGELREGFLYVTALLIREDSGMRLWTAGP